MSVSRSLLLLLLQSVVSTVHIQFLFRIQTLRQNYFGIHIALTDLHVYHVGVIFQVYILAPSSTASCSPSEAPRYNLCSKRVKREIKASTQFYPLHRVLVISFIPLVFFGIITMSSHKRQQPFHVPTDASKACNLDRG